MAWPRLALPLSVALSCALLVLAARGPNAFSRPAEAASAAQLFGSAPLVQGRLLFVKDGSLYLWANGNANKIGDGWNWSQPRWAPDGTRFVWSYRGANFSDIFISDALAGNSARLTRSQSSVLQENDWNFRPAWSPDGRQIVYATDTATEYPTIWVMSADGSGRKPLPIGGVQFAVDQLAWSPDGSQLAFSLFTERSGLSQVATFPMGGSARAGTRIVTQNPAGAMDPAWSPDGAWIAYAARGERQTDVYVMRPDGTGAQRLTSSGMVRLPEWSPDGRQIAFLSAQTGVFEVWVLDVQADGRGGLKASNERQLTRDLGVDAPSGLSWTR